MNIVFPEHIIVTDQEIDCTHLSAQRKDFIISFTKRLIALYKEQGEGRKVYAIAGPSGSGKSYLSILTETLSKQIDADVRIIPVSIDAYHFPNEYLSQTATLGGTLKDVKGRFDTYDVPALLSDLQDFKDGNSMRLPVYSRKLHEPISGEIKVTDGPAIMLIEGLWLLYSEHEGIGWREISGLFDHSYFLDDSPASLRAHTIERHVRGGREEGDAARQYDEHDAQNKTLVLATKERADEKLTWPAS